MWISKKEYEKLKADECRKCTYKSEWKCMKEGTMTFFHDAVTIDTNYLYRLNEENKELRTLCEEKDAQIKEYQQKYADEVQKRLALIQQMKE